MDPKLSMLENVRLASEHQSADSVKGEGLFACAIGPIWMDSSTTQQCKELGRRSCVFVSILLVQCIL